ncbi:hypothetical protein IF2G_09520 [Cordyceps javanica]|nr:hypothetical protein IF2G_09520 [Cordyceps javanica]
MGRIERFRGDSTGSWTERMQINVSITGSFSDFMPLVNETDTIASSRVVGSLLFPCIRTER